MRLRSICVHVDWNPSNKVRMRARCFQYEGKTDIVWGRSIVLMAKTTEECRQAIDKHFRDRVRAVWVTYDDSLQVLNHWIEFFDNDENPISDEERKKTQVTGPRI